MVDTRKQSLQIDLSLQQLRVVAGGEITTTYAISTALNGPGEQQGSGCTPRGLHRIRLKIGAGLPENAVFIGRRYTGEIYTPELANANPQRDWILTRILWLTGLESGNNRGGSVDSLRRFIYIHGTPDHEPMGAAASHGCIRMRNSDILTLFNQVPVGTLVDIRETF
ncbi:L,D-transpeptidase [Sedimenticola selenatireducens]|uniref:L,D-transpeptidase n=1 Tax=Sedimenticola selenatireducens TaxID=191960 RepID=A0A557RZC7_9GAMM|nr:L,D-transpeptidase [Sedimenticola selenatireducens]TVO70510.1 L,D-transpeptidase [Sedimenticola selenatireducens]TVT63087.1 MAG: L,D-transpeptidase [Sedimenticola selenatireducens]